MDILNKLLLKDLQEIAKIMQIEVVVGQKKRWIKKTDITFTGRK